MENFRTLQISICVTLLQWESVRGENYLCKTGLHILSQAVEFWIGPRVFHLSPDNDPVFWGLEEGRGERVNAYDKLTISYWYLVRRLEYT